jgi:hypothetical protein
MEIFLISRILRVSRADPEVDRLFLIRESYQEARFLRTFPSLRRINQDNRNVLDWGVRPLLIHSLI